MYCRQIAQKVKTLAELLKERKIASNARQLVSETNIGNLLGNAENVVQKTEVCANKMQQCNKLTNVHGVDSVLKTGKNQISTKFEGIKLAEGTRETVQYTARNGDKTEIFEIFADESSETLKRDQEMLEKLCSNMSKYLDIHQIPAEGNDNRMIIETTLQIMREMLAKGNKCPKTHMYIAVSNGKLCGALVGGLEKSTKNGGTIFAARKNATQKVTELNWTAAWPQGNGVGKLMLAEYMRTMKKDGFKFMDIQSEIPEMSYASKFYRRMGFSKIFRKSPKKPVSKFEYHDDKLDCLNLDNPDNLMYDYDIIPMIGNQRYLQKISDRIAQEFHRETFLKVVDTREFIRELNVAC